MKTYRTTSDQRNNFHLIGFVFLALLLLAQNSYAQQIDTAKDRVKTDIKIALPYLGTVKARSTREIESSNWLLGCETLDRDFADYDQYKEYIAPLGIKRLRMQAGWARTGRGAL